MTEKKLENKAVNIQGKKYVLVSDRVLFFNEKYPKGCIQADVSYEGSYVRCTAKVFTGEGDERCFTGHAEELRGSGHINKTSAVENCETSAVGRALAMMGIGVIDSIASVDEIQVAKNKEKAITAGPGPASAKQVNMIKALVSQKKGIKSDVFTETFFKDLTKKRASEAIDYLQKQDDNLPDDDIANVIEIPVVESEL